MRGNTHQPQPFVMVDMLESRMLLAANWVGTWQVQGVDLTMRSLPPNGALAVTSPALTVDVSHATGNTYTAVLTTKVGKTVRTETRTLTANGQELVGNFTSEDTAANNEVIHWQTYIRLMAVDADVMMFDSTSVGYTDSNTAQRIYELNMYAGLASQQKLQVVNFPYTGDYSFHGFRMEAGTQNSQLQVTAADSPRTAKITSTGGKTYNIATQDVEGITTTNPFRDRAGRLSQISVFPLTQSKSYLHYLQMYYRGPDGRLYFRSGGMEANTDPGRTDAAGAIPVGQILSGVTWAGYSDVAPYNFAPVMTPGTITLNPIDEDQTQSQGTLVSQIVGASSITDWNTSGRKGIAVVATNNRYGTWEYSTNGGAAWQSVGKVSTGHALLLSDSDQNQIRFVPKANYNGTVAKAITFRAWDQGTGANGAYASAAKAGKLTAFSTTRNTATLQVNAVDDAPVLSGTLAGLDYAGLPLRIGGGLKIADVDNKLLAGATVQITGGFSAGDTLTYPGTVKGITTVPVMTDGLVALTGAAPLSAYLAAIRSITFTSSSSVSGLRTISITVNDGTLSSNTLTQAVRIAAAMGPLAASPFSDTPLTGDVPALLA